MVTYPSVFLPLIRLGASVTTLPATTLELELQAKLAAAQAQINALMEQRDKQQEGGFIEARNEMYRRMDAELWDQSILQDHLIFSNFSGMDCVLSIYAKYCYPQ